MSDTVEEVQDSVAAIMAVVVVVVWDMEEELGMELRKADHRDMVEHDSDKTHYNRAR